MKDLLKYLSTAPVVGTIWLTLTAGLVIEINRFYPDALTFPFA
jgi:photosystem I subunit 9